MPPCALEDEKTLTRYSRLFKVDDGRIVGLSRNRIPTSRDRRTCVIGHKGLTNHRMSGWKNQHQGIRNSDRGDVGLLLRFVRTDLGISNQKKNVKGDGTTFQHLFVP